MIASENLKGKSGIYCAIHRDSLKCYVGSSKNIGGRLREHLSCARNGRSTAFYRAVRELGHEAFDFEVIELCDKSELLKREEFWISFYNSASLNGFNTNSWTTSYWGGEVSQATRDRISASKTGKTSPAIKAAAIRAGERRRGVKRPAYVGERLRALFTGKKMAPEQVAKLKMIFAGRKFPQHALASAVAANTGKERSEQVKDKIRESVKRVWMNRSKEKHDAIIRAMHVGRGVIKT